MGFLDGLISLFTQDYQNKKSQQRQYEYNSTLAAEQQEYNKELMGISQGYNLENAQKQYEYNTQLQQQQYGYNSTLAQMQNNMLRQNTQDSAALQKRGLAAAGINTASLGGGSAQLAGVGSLASVSAPSSGLPSAPGSSAGLPSSTLAAVDLASIIRSTAAADLDRTKAKGEEINNAYKGQQNEASIRLAEAQAANFETNAQLNVKKLPIAEQEYKNLVQSFNNLVKTAENIDADTWLKTAEAYRARNTTDIAWEQLSLNAQMAASQIDLNSAHASEALKHLAVMDEEISLMANEMRLNDEQKMLFHQQAYKAQEEGNQEKFKADILNKLNREEMARWKKAEIIANVLEHYNNAQNAHKNFLRQAGELMSGKTDKDAESFVETMKQVAE
ncbi:hypothetical protein [Capybara microvirus Cap1_SP_59]|nr:hypothetical protein [Capybara microvirus Cap1_SP_59]